jgi:hypothetical protein
VEGDSVIADFKALLLDALDKCEYKLLVFVCIANESRSHGAKLTELVVPGE